MKIKLILLLSLVYTFNAFAADSSGTGQSSATVLECKSIYLQYLADNAINADSSGTGKKTSNDGDSDKTFQFYLDCINQLNADSSGTG